MMMVQKKSDGDLLLFTFGAAVIVACASVRFGRPGRVEQLFENPNGKGTARQMVRRVGSLYRAVCIEPAVCFSVSRAPGVVEQKGRQIPNEPERTKTSERRWEKFKKIVTFNSVGCVSLVSAARHVGYWERSVPYDLCWWMVLC